MARYKHQDYIGMSDSELFDAKARPESLVPAEGIYRCERCGIELALRVGARFPSDHHVEDHPEERSAWRLVVAAETEDAPI